MQDDTSNQNRSTDLSDAVEYARRTHKHNLDWYNNADTKAEIILGINGIFLAFVTSSIFIRQDYLKQILESFTPFTWSMLGLMSLCLAGSIICSIACLWSRISLITRRNKDHDINKQGIQADNMENILPETTFFFQYIIRIDPELYVERLLSADMELEISALASSIYALSKNVLIKHRLVDISFILTGFSLIFFLSLGMSYLTTLV